MLEEQIRVSPVLTIGPQVSENDIKALADDGYVTVINLSKKGECDQILSPIEEKEVVESADMNYIHKPLSLYKLRMETIDDICGELATLIEEGPVYLHCRIGQRSSLLGWIFHGMRRNFTHETVLKRARKKGIRWRSPYLETMLSKYLERSRGAREKVLRGEVLT